MARKRRRKKKDDTDSEQGSRFWYTTIGILIVFVIGFFILRNFL